MLLFDTFMTILLLHIVRFLKSFPFLFFFFGAVRGCPNFDILLVLKFEIF